MTTDLAVVGPSSGALALRSDQQRFTDEQFAALTQIGVEKAKPGDLAVFMHVAQRTGLDPFSRQIYMIERGGKQTIQTGIDGFRVIAERRPEYVGQTPPQWCGEDGQWREIWTDVKPPTAARVGILRTDWKEPAWGVALLREFRVDNSPTWKGKPAHMLAIRAEALGFRKAFPNDMAGLMTPEEAEDAGRTRVRATAAQDAAPVTVAELTGGTPVPAGEDVNGRMTSAQQRKLFACIRDADIENRNEWASGQLGREITSFGQLSVGDAALLIDRLEQGLAILNGEAVDAEPAAEQ